jgi:hypothetical protein
VRTVDWPVIVVVDHVVAGHVIVVVGHAVVVIRLSSPRIFFITV